MSDPEGRGDDVDRHDETLDDDVDIESLPGGAVRDELLRQRLAHGLLRVAAESAEASRRAERVRGILDAVAAADRIAAVDSDAVAALDETLDDEVHVEALPPGAARAELARQRLMHGLLSAVFDTGAATSHDRRVHAIVDAAAAGEDAARNPARGGGRILPFPGRWTRIAVAAGVVIAATVGWQLVFGGARGDLRLEAVAKEMGKALDRRFLVIVDQIDANPIERMGEHVLWSHPLPDGRTKFRIMLNGARSGQQDVGSDALVVWRQNRADPGDKESRGVAEANAMFASMASSGTGERLPEIDDPDHFDLHKLIERLAGHAEIHAESASYVDAKGQRVQTFYAEHLNHPDFGELSSLLLRVDLDANVFDVLEFVRVDSGGDGLFRYRFEYQGVDPQPESFYDQPW